MLKVGPGTRSRGPRHQQGEGARLPRPQADPEESVGRNRRAASPSARRSRARSRTSCLTARSSKSKRASKASSTSPNSPGPSASPARATCSPSARKSKPSCSASTRRSRRSPSASASSSPILGTRSSTATRSASRSRARSATSPPTARSSNSKKASTAWSTSPTCRWTRKINHPSEVLKKGDEVEAVVIDIDKTNQRISLGMKQLDDDPWKAIESKLQDRRPRQGQGLARSPASARSSSSKATSTASCTSRRSAKTASTRSRTSSRSARKSKPASSRSTRPSAASVSPIKAANYSEEDIKREAAAFDTLKPGEDMVGLEQAFAAAPRSIAPATRRRSRLLAQHRAPAAQAAFKRRRETGGAFVLDSII